MAWLRGINLRLVVITLLALAILVAFYAATGGGFPAPPATAVPPTPAPTPTVGPSSRVQGTVTAQVRHRGGRSWQFIYTVRDTGKAPIGGLQLNAPPSNLFEIKASKGWNFFGSGVCAGHYPGILVYFSTAPVGGNPIAPDHSQQFSFKVNTTGTTTIGYAISWGSDRPQFGTVVGPKPSNLPPSAACK